MKITSTLMSTPILFKVLPTISYTPILALEWFDLADGNVRAVDRSDKNDYVICEIETVGTESYINNIIQSLKVDKFLTLSEFASDEMIFGANVDYNATVKAVWTNMTMKKQKTLNTFSLILSLTSTDITYITGSGYLPSLSCVQIGYTGDTSWGFDVEQTYRNTSNSGSVYVYQNSNDIGEFIGQFILTNEEMAELLYFQKAQRSSPFVLPSIGVPYPFGPRQTGPYDAVLREITGVSYFSPTMQICTITINQFKG